MDSSPYKFAHYPLYISSGENKERNFNNLTSDVAWLKSLQ